AGEHRFERRPRAFGLDAVWMLDRERVFGEQRPQRLAVLAGLERGVQRTRGRERRTAGLDGRAGDRRDLATDDAPATAGLARPHARVADRVAHRRAADLDDDARA